MSATNTHRCRVCGRDCPADVPECIDCRATDAGHVPSIVASDGETVFAYGEVVAGRYRIVRRVGRGGMGVVYRAADLRLGQDVAVKLLPDRFAADPDHLARFHAEVRLARQVSHPNVCRVYDIGEHQGRVFLTMEFVPGGDLQTLLKPVGRLPEEQALAVARQLCGAVEAVHDRGLLHRDLKPANVLLDDDRNVRLVDFGIAALAGEAADVRSGTAAYQAPEVLAGREVTIQSDLFALGLVLYEVFTGKAAFPARSLDDLARLHDSGPADPSSHLRTLDPAVERVILRCLKKNPAERPRSAAEIRAALPGALQAAIDAGQTPSPEFVADTGGAGTISVTMGVALIAFILVGMLAIAWVTDRDTFHRRLPLTPPAVLRDKAQKLAKSLGYGDTGDSAEGVVVDHRDFRPAPTPDEWRRMQDAVVSPEVFYWYRQRPGDIVHRLSPNDIMGYGLPGLVTASEPELIRGDLCVILDRKGNLIELHARPDLVPSDDKPDPKPLFAAAGLDFADFKEATPARDPVTHCDHRAAWAGPFPKSADRTLVVEMATRGGKVAYFHVAERRHGDDVSPSPDRVTLGDVPPDAGTWLSEVAYGSIRLLALTVGAWLARRNVKRGTANLTGASRLAAVYFATYMVMWLFLARHTLRAADEWAIFTAALGAGCANSLTLWVIYLALEPFVRRHRPEWVIGWNRLLRGRWRDPAVGRDVLIGAAFGITWALLNTLRRTTIPEMLGMAYVPYPVWMATLTAGPVGVLAAYAGFPLFFQLLEFFILVIVYFASGRRKSVSLVVWWAFWTFRWALVVSGPVFGESIGIALWSIVSAGVLTSLAVFALWRFGLLAFVVFGQFAFTLVDLPVTLDRNAWYLSTSVGVMGCLGTIAVFGYRTATADLAAPVATRGGEA